MSIADSSPEIPLLDSAQKKLAALGDQINDLAAPQLGKVSARVRGQPLTMLLVALGLGVIGGYLLKR